MSSPVSTETIQHFIWRKTYFSEENTTPLFHYDIVNHYLSPGSYIKPVKAFRGSAKSTNTCYMALHRVEDPTAFYTLIVSDTASQAESLVADISDMIGDSRLPYRVVRDVQGELQLNYMGRDYYIVAKGAGASLRGIKRARRRPDLIILDDIINDELVLNRLRVDRLNRWFYKALLPSLSPGGRIYAVGTPLSQNDLFMSLCSLHPTIEIPLEKGVWPDRFSDEWIDSKRREYEKAGMLREFKQEFELIVADSETSIFDMSKVRFIDERELPEGLNYYATLDGAFSEKEYADKSAFAVLGIDSEGRWYLIPYAMRDRLNVVIDRMFELQSMYGFYDIGIEKGSFKLSLESEVERRMMDYQQYFNIVPLSTSGSKVSRIKALAPVVNSGRLTIVDTGEDAEELVEQMELTDDMGCHATHDDLLDAAAQLLQMELVNYTG